MDDTAMSAKPKRDWPQVPPNYVSLRDLQELRRKEKEQQERERQRGVEAVRGEGAAAATPAPKAEERRGSSEKPWGGGGERSYYGAKKWAAVAPPTPTRADCAARKVGGDVGVVDVAHREDAPRPTPTRAGVAGRKVGGAMEVEAVAQRVAPGPSPSPQYAAKKMDGATGVLAVAQPEEPQPRRLGEDEARKREGPIGGRAVKGADETAASAFQAGAKPDSKGKGKVAASTIEPRAPAEAATVSSPGGTPEEERKGKVKGKASGDQSTAPATSGAPREPTEAASASSGGRGKPAIHRIRRKGGVGRSSVTATPGDTSCVVEQHNKGKKKASGARHAGAAPASDSSDMSLPALTSNSPDGKSVQPASINNSPDGTSAQQSPAADFSSSRRSGGALGKTGETKPPGLVGEKPPAMDSKAITARLITVTMGSARLPSIRSPRQQHAGGQPGGVWVPKAVAPAPSRHFQSFRKNS
ncbi:collagen alpha-2(I) chain-like [Oryza brachyantha]|uniref:collagen alpha-2(I) chain-like n=1 Tax=Oryza brachyantha TaxID=4533 RepID=UPI0003EACCDE|nr:collagen alpha-2(I) chain-like [Oryza brachyantha]